MVSIFNGAWALLTGKQAACCTQTAAITIAAVSFVAGMLVSCVVCKLRRKCACQGGGQAKRRREQPKFEKTHPAPADGSIEIYVGNLSYDLTEDVLRKEFEAYGKVNSARIIMNRYNGKSKGFGFVHMPNRDEASAAIAALSDKEILSRRLRCNEAKNVAL